ncbi:MAG: 3-keto-5-aminohexanoate cleavage protein, partial [Microvirga sp.]|nr:3-keto-5-aminohexanoate cleavage protein [Microvirga sp.]
MAGARKVWVEAALNGPWGRDRQAGIPVSVSEIVAEGVACAKAGAAIIHLHAYDESTGLQRDDADLYAAIIDGVRAQVDAIVYPSIPLSGDTRVGETGAQARFAAVAELARRGLLEWAVVDPGSCNFERYPDLAAGRSGFIYRNPPEDVAEGLALAERYGFHPSYAIYEPGFLRLGAALARARPGMPGPIYRFM